MAIYKGENLLISGGKQGSVFFWNDNGNIVRKISQLVKTEVFNLIVVKRPLELNHKKSIIHIKKALVYKPFKKYFIINIITII